MSYASGMQGSPTSGSTFEKVSEKLILCCGLGFFDYQMVLLALPQIDVELLTHVQFEVVLKPRWQAM